MTRILAFSDLHTELQRVDPAAVQPEAPVDLVIAAGDIGQGAEAVRWLAQAFPTTPVLFVPGNHEYYGGWVHATGAAMRAAAQGTLVTLLDPGTWEEDGLRVLGCTLWTDYALFGEPFRMVAMREAGRNLADHELIRGFSPAEALERHHAERAWLEEQLARPFAGQTVVVTHHAPHPGGVAERYRDDLLSAAFASDLSAMIGRYQPELWVFGYTHHSTDRMLGGTRLYAMQLGYAEEGLPFRAEVIELAGERRDG